MAIDLTKGSISHHIRTLALPASIGMVFNTLYNVVDTFYSGKIGTDSLAGLTVSFPIFFIILAISSGIGSRTTALSSIAIGEKDNERYHSLMKNSLYIGVIIACVIIFIAPSISEFLLKAIQRAGNRLEKDGLICGAN